MNAILPISSFGPHAVESLLDLTFGTDRRSRTAYRLREGQRYVPELSVGIADDAGGLIAVLQCWPISLVQSGYPDTRMVLVGPVAVKPTLQRSGLGQAMMYHALAKADEQAETAITMMIGDPEYYGRFFGYDAAPTAEWGIDGPVERRRLLVRKPAGIPLPRSGDVLPGWRDRTSAAMGRAA